MKLLFLIILFVSVGFILPIVAFTQTFTPLAPGMPDLFDGTVAWGDYDDDDDLDLLVTGRASGIGNVTAIYRNDAGTLIDIEAGLEAVYSGQAEWGDYDNDGDLDFIIGGWNSSSNIVTILYRNDGGSTFSEIATDIIGVSQGDVSWGDYDNDGDLDLLIMGGADYPVLEIMRLYRNDGNGAFVDTEIGFEGIRRGSVEWADYDGDGDLDILATGHPGTFGVITRVYRNDGNDLFVNIEAGFFNQYDGQAKWGDYDQDGDPDIYINGSDSTAGNFYSFVYRNDGGDVFTDINATLDDAGEGSSLVIGDYDNDGDFDVGMSSIFTTSGFSVDILRYDSAAIFTSLNAGLDEGCCGSMAPGDYDNDGDLDIMASLHFASTYLYRNEVDSANTAPDPPTGLSENVNGNSVMMSWHSGSDSQTSTLGLTYNIRLGTTPGGHEIVSSMSNSGGGYRKIVALGNVSQNLSWEINNLSDGTYYWSVQTIDNNFAGSVFAPERNFTISGAPFTCGDLNDDDAVNILDLTYLITYLYQGGPPPDPLGSADTNGDGNLNILDITYLIEYIYFDGPVPICS